MKTKIRINRIVIAGLILAITFMVASINNISVLEAESNFIVGEYDYTRSQLNTAQELISSLEQDNMMVENKNIELNEEIIELSDKVELLAHKEREIEVKTDYENYEIKLEEESNLFINKYNLTNYELNILYRIVESEATGGSFNSKVNVTHVIINRVAGKDFPNTIEAVVFQNRQFSPIKDGRYYTVKITQSTIDAVNHAIRNEDTTFGSLFFMQREASDKSNVSWFDRALEFVFKDDIGHSFFRKK